MLSAQDQGADSSDFFGFFVALAGDTALIGASFDEPSSINTAGSAYVFGP